MAPTGVSGCARMRGKDDRRWSLTVKVPEPGPRAGRQPGLRDFDAVRYHGDEIVAEPVSGTKKPRNDLGHCGALRSGQWAIEELNLGPHAYQACALTT